MITKTEFLSAGLLVVANLVTIYFVIVEGWSIGTVLWIYLIQSVIIGFFIFLRILSLKEFSTEHFYIHDRPIPTTKKTKMFAALFFVLHYSFFHFAYFTSLIGIAFLEIDIGFVLQVSAIFFVTHLFSFIQYRNRLQKRHHIIHIMFFPYARIVPMHLIILLGLFINSIETIIFFLLLKTGADVIMHIVEHRENWV